MSLPEGGPNDVYTRFLPGLEEKSDDWLSRAVNE